MKLALPNAKGGKLTLSASLGEQTKIELMPIALIKPTCCRMSCLLTLLAKKY
ncbi:hypothetical protein D3C71_295940 [compost metagenome]